MSAGPELPRHTRRQPPEWEGLLAHAEDLLGDDWPVLKPFEQATVTTMDEIVSKLDNETLEANRYYALGVITCEAARSLSDESGRQIPINHAAREISTKSWVANQKLVGVPYEGIRLNDLRRIDGSVVTSLEVIWQRHLQPSTRLVADSLQAEAVDRLLELAHRPDLRSEAQTRSYLGLISNSVHAVGADMFSGAIETYHALLLHRWRNKGGLTYNPLIHDIISTEELRTLDTHKVGMNAARLRLDEFKKNHENLVTDNPVSGPSFARTRVPAEPPEIIANQGIDGSVVLHEARLACPALHVSRAIPLVLDLMPEIITQAQEMAEENISPRIELIA